MDEEEKQNEFDINNLSNFIKEFNKKILDVDGLSMLPNVTLGISHYDDYSPNISIHFLGDSIWDSGCHPYSEDLIMEMIIDEILCLDHNLHIIAENIRNLISKGEMKYGNENE